MHAAIIASLAALAVAAPSKRQAATPPTGVNDAIILQYALTLEHLENAFYREALAKFSAEDFKKAGLKSSFIDNLKTIASDEKVHVNYLTAGLTAAGATPVAECSYNFGFSDVPTFLAISNVLEGVGISAYLGAAKYVKSPDYLTAAGSILTVESRHSAYIRENQGPALSPYPAPFDIAQEFNNVFSLAAPFITACPAGPTSSIEVLSAVGFAAFPALAVTPAGTKQAGDILSLAVNATAVPEVKAAWFATSGGWTQATLSGSGSTYQVTVPAVGVPNLQPGTVAPGQAYLVLTKDEKTPTDDNTAAGPAVFEIADDAFGRKADDKDCTTIVAYPTNSESAKGYPTKSEAPKGYPTNSEGPKEYPSKHETESKYEHKPTATYSSKVEKPTHESKPAPYYPTTTEHAKPYGTGKVPVHESTSTSCTSDYAKPTGYSY